jgi:hypothetical protein
MLTSYQGSFLEQDKMDALCRVKLKPRSSKYGADWLLTQTVSITNASASQCATITLFWSFWMDLEVSPGDALIHSEIVINQSHHICLFSMVLQFSWIKTLALFLIVALFHNLSFGPFYSISVLYFHALYLRKLVAPESHLRSTASHFRRSNQFRIRLRRIFIK